MRPPVIIALTVTGFVALVVAALGLLSLVTDTDVIATPGLGPLPGVLAVAVTGLVLAAALVRVLRSDAPSYLSAVWIGIAGFVAYIATVATAAMVGGTAPAVALSAAGQLAIGWPAPTVALCTAGAAWVAVALRRTRTARPRWPWEDEFDE